MPIGEGRHKAWYSRGYLPHFDVPGTVQGVTFRLRDAVPHELVERWRKELGWYEDMKADDPAMVALRERIARYEDAGHGACWLARREIGRMVEDALLHFDGERYRLLAWCVMPNHVHALIKTHDGFPLGDVVQSWKSFTAHEANKVLGRRGEFWMVDYHGRYIRDEKHFTDAIRYIERNPVKAGLVKRAEDWPLSSARRRLFPGPRASRSRIVG
jgi:putative transposase